MQQSMDSQQETLRGLLMGLKDQLPTIGLSTSTTSPMYVTSSTSTPIHSTLSNQPPPHTPTGFVSQTYA